MIDTLRKHIINLVDMNASEMNQLLDNFTLQKIRRKQLIIQPGYVSRQRYYIRKGSFKAYIIGPDAKQHIIQFAIEDWWITDGNSFLYQKPASMFIEALEDCEVYALEYSAEVRLKSLNHKFETFFRILAERAATYHQRRIISSLTLSPEERYYEFVKTYPAVVQRLPVFLIASYLGISRQSLTKIRSKL